MKIIRAKELDVITGISRTTRWRLERLGDFPKRIKLSQSAVGWRESEIFDWISKRVPVSGQSESVPSKSCDLKIVSKQKS